MSMLSSLVQVKLNRSTNYWLHSANKEDIGGRLIRHFPSNSFFTSPHCCEHAQKCYVDRVISWALGDFFVEACCCWFSFRSAATCKQILLISTFVNKLGYLSCKMCHYQKQVLYSKSYISSIHFTFPYIAFEISVRLHL